LTLYRLLEHEHAREGDFEPTRSRNQAKRPSFSRTRVSFTSPPRSSGRRGTSMCGRIRRSCSRPSSRSSAGAYT